MANRAGWQSQSLPTNDACGNGAIDKPPERRDQSIQTGFRYPLKPTLTVKTHRDSLQSSWGASNRAPKTIHWTDVNVRQYEITVGDNPSVSSGPPVRYVDTQLRMLVSNANFLTHVSRIREILVLTGVITLQHNPCRSMRSSKHEVPEGVKWKWF
jgi:hypothetical protein